MRWFLQCSAIGRSVHAGTRSRGAAEPRGCRRADREVACNPRGEVQSMLRSGSAVQWNCFLYVMTRECRADRPAALRPRVNTVCDALVQPEHSAQRACEGWLSGAGIAPHPGHSARERDDEIAEDLCCAEGLEVWSQDAPVAVRLECECAQHGECNDDDPQQRRCLVMIR